MKKLFLIAFASIAMVACNDANDKTVVETSETTDLNTSSTTYTATDGDVTFRNDKVMVMKNGDWVEADKDVTLNDGVVVYKNGRVTHDGHEVVLKDGEIVTRTGRFFDNTGHAIENAWDATKEGAKDAGKAIKDGAKKVGKEVEEAFDGKKNN